MKVLHVGKYYPPFFGGIEKVNFDLVENLNHKRDCEVDELCFHHSIHNEDLPEPTEYHLFRAPLIAIKFSTPISLGFFKIYRKIRNNYDIIHFHMPNPVASMALLIFPTRAKLVLHWHSDIVKQKILKKVYKPFQTMLLNRADRIIVTSQNYFRGSLDLQPYEKKISVIPIGVGMEHLSFQKGTDKRIRTSYQDKKIILSIGRLTYYKGFRYLIEAAQYLKDDTIILIGGIGELQTELEAIIQKLNVGDRVRLIGRIPENEIGAYFAAADIFCLPSIVRTEAFGVVLAEALAMGVPIVACNIPNSGVNWVNLHNVTGLNVPVRNAPALAEAITTILNSPKLRDQFHKNCIIRYNTYFSVEKMVDMVYALYQKILANG